MVDDLVMPVVQQPCALLRSLVDAHVEFLVVGDMAAVLQGVPCLPVAIDIVHHRTSENVVRLLAWLRAHAAYDSAAIPDRALLPSEDALLGHGDIFRIQTDLGRLNVSSRESYEFMLPDTVLVGPDELARLIALNAHDGHEDRTVLPVLLARRRAPAW
jgi:hypothetical protein